MPDSRVTVVVPPSGEETGFRELAGFQKTVVGRIESVESNNGFDAIADAAMLRTPPELRGMKASLQTAGPSKEPQRVRL